MLAAAAFSAVSWTAGWKPGKLPAAEELGTFQSFATRWWGWQPKEEPGWPETLVVYIFSNTDPEYFNNLKFFLKWGVREGDGAYYIIVVQEGGKSPVRHLLLLAATCPGRAALEGTTQRISMQPALHQELFYSAGQAAAIAPGLVS